MRYFFLFLLYIWLILGANIGLLKAEETSAKNGLVSPVLTDLFKNGMDSKSPLSEKKGIGDWQSTPYGKIRLLSRESGTKELNNILMALEVNINPDTTIKNPVLKISQSQNVKDHRFLIPVPRPFQKDSGLTYQKEVVFPIYLTLQKANLLVEVSVDLSVQYCPKEETCSSDLQTVSLSVPGGYNYFTPFSAFVDSAFEFIPAEATKDQIEMGALSENTFWVMLGMPHSIQQPEFLFLDAQTFAPIPYTLTHSDIDNKRARFVFHAEENIENKPVTLYLADKKRFYTQTMNLKKTDIPSFLPTEKNHLPPFYLWFIFLLFSPCLAFLFQQRPRNEIVAKQDTIKNILGIVLGILCGAFIYTAIPYATLSTSILWLSFGALLFGFLGIFSYPITHFGYGLLTAVVPFFFFLKNNEIAVPTTLSELAYFFCIMAILNALPFAVFLIKPYWLVKMGQIFKSQSEYKLRFSFFLDTILFGLMLLFTLI